MSKRRSLVAVVAVALTSSCLELTLPDPPGPGSIQGTVVYFKPGRAAPIAAAGAKVSLKNTGVSATANADGFFRAEPITRSTGQLLISFDADGDGRADRQRLLDLATINAGVGRDVALGQVTLGLNALLSGKVLRDDLGAARGGHGGTAVLVPEGPYATVTADDGSFLLPDLPEGPVSIGFFREGYELVVQETSVRAGEEVRLQDLRLSRASGAPAPSSVRGRVVMADGSRPAGVTVHLGRSGLARGQATTQDDGAFRFEGLEPGPYDVVATRDGLSTVTVRNALLAGGERVLADLVMSAGSSTPPDFTAPVVLDAGVIDGGPLDAGSDDAGVLPDGGVPEPVARVWPNPVVVALDPALDGGEVGFTVDGALSTGAGPLKFFWESLDVGDGLTVATSSEFSSRAQLGLSFGSAPRARTYAFRLSVEDALGRRSAWAPATARAAYRPVAVLTPSSATAPAALSLSSAGSSDRDGLPLTHRFFILSGAATLASAATSTTVTATAPGVVVVGCEVENSFGLVSARVSATVTFSAAGDAGLSVYAGADQVVDAGAVVQLSGQVAGTSQPYDVVWSEAPPSLPPALVFDDITSLTPRFTAPSVAGGDQLRRLRLTVTQPAGCAPGACTVVSESETRVVILDRAGPVAQLDVGPTRPLGRFAFVSVEFDEPIDVGAGLPVMTLERLTMTSPVAVPVTVVQDAPAKFRVVPTSALAVGFTHRLTIAAGVRDLTTAANVAPAQSVEFGVRAPVVAVVPSPPVSAAPGAPRPGVAVVPKRPQGPSQPMLVVAARRDDLSDQVIVYNPTPAASPALSQQPSIIVSGLSGTSPARRLVAVGSRVYAALEVNSGSFAMTTDGVLLSIDVATTNPLWQQHVQSATPPMTGPWTTSLPGPLFTDGASLFTLGATPSDGVRVARFTQGAGWPDFVTTPAGSEQLSSFNTQPGQVRAAGATLQGVRTVAWVDQTTSQLHLARSAGVGAVWMGGATHTYAVAPKSLRLAVTLNGFDQQLAFVASAPNITGSDVLRLDTRIDGTTPGVITSPATAPTPGFDLVASSAHRHVYLAAISAGELFVWRRASVVSGGWEAVDGVNGNQSFQASGCVPGNPELAVSPDEALFLVWAERCGTADWVIKLAKVE